MELLNTSKDFYLLRLDPGEELRGEVEKFCLAMPDLAKRDGSPIRAAWINALGSCQELELAYYNLGKKEYETKSFSEDLEIATVVGNIALKDNKPFIHIHGTFSNREMEVIGGHIMKCVILATCEVMLWKIEGEMSRKHDEFTGLDLLCSRR